jgi:hypothetical protein
MFKTARADKRSYTIEVLNHVFMRFNAENDLSASADATGIDK